MNFFGGLSIVLGFLTRPAALASTFVLLTPAGQMQLLADGGATLLAGPTGVQLKTEWNSLFWSAGAAPIAAFGGGAYSIERMLMRKEG